MTFVYALALAVGLLAVAPYLAHRLRRRRAEERDFAAARLVAPAPPRARSRARLEDRALFATRFAAVFALALLGASPLVHCSRLSLSRASGASVAMAIVIDDSMSMRAKLGASTRFGRAREGARELLASAREGDAVAIVLAGAPARVALAATTDLSAARKVVEALEPSDRGTDLDASLVLARGLVSELPQVDRRVVVLSDLADGRPDAPPVGGEAAGGVPVWIPLPELRGPATDCGVLAADRSDARVHVLTACSPDATTKGREAALVFGNDVLARAPVPEERKGEVILTLSPDDAKRTEGRPLSVRLSGADAIATDDVAPVVEEAGPRPVAVVTDEADFDATSKVPIVEQALRALELDIAVRPVPAVSDRAEDLAPFLGVIVDDPKGLTPEQRHALGSFIESGGFVLLALGPRAASAPIGASLAPVLRGATSWETTSSTGANPETAAGAFAESAPSGADLGAKKRTVVAAEDLGALTPLVSWTDGAPLFARKALGRGEAWIVTLPFTVDASDLLLRPLFLALLDAWTTEARKRTAPRRTDVGTTWSFPGARAVDVVGPGGPLTRNGANPSVTPGTIGLFSIAIDGKKESRVAAPVEAEIDMRARRASPSASGVGMGDAHASVDASPSVAFLLLVLLAIEMGLRLRARVHAEAT